MDILKTESLFKELMEQGLGLDLSDPNLADTPRRFAKMIGTELMANQEADIKNLDNII